MFECLLYSEDGREGGDRTKDSLVSLSTKHPLTSNMPQSGILTKTEALKDVRGVQRAIALQRFICRARQWSLNSKTNLRSIHFLVARGFVIVLQLDLSSLTNPRQDQSVHLSAVLAFLVSTGVTFKVALASKQNCKQVVNYLETGALD